MRIQHKPGDAIQVDWTGDTIPVYDPVTDEQSPAYLFVAVLPCSRYTYAEVCEDMKTENCLNCCIRRIELAICTEKIGHLAGDFSPLRRRRLPVQKAGPIL